MGIQYLKKAVKTASTDDTKTREIVEGILKEIEKTKVYEDMIIPADFDYNEIKSISNESREKLIQILPETIGQAQRINGIRPTDISILLVYLKRWFHVKRNVNLKKK